MAYDHFLVAQRRLWKSNLESRSGDQPHGEFGSLVQAALPVGLCSDAYELGRQKVSHLQSIDECCSYASFRSSEYPKKVVQMFTLSLPSSNISYPGEALDNGSVHGKP